LIGHCVSPQPWREIDAHGAGRSLWHKTVTKAVNKSVDAF